MAYNDAIILMFEKIRALTEDFAKTATEAFTYETYNVFTLSEPRVNSIVEVLINGNEFVSGQSYTYDSATNKITVVNPSFEVNDIVTITYNYSKSSNTELFEYIRAALVWLGIYESTQNTYKLMSSGAIFPIPKPKTIDLICVIAAILIKPDYISYKTSNMSVTYPSKMSKEDKIKETVSNFNYGTGVNSVITWLSDKE